MYVPVLIFLFSILLYFIYIRMINYEEFLSYENMSWLMQCSIKMDGMGKWERERERKKGAGRKRGEIKYHTLIHWTSERPWRRPSKSHVIFAAHL